jgi:hypothetical protein
VNPEPPSKQPGLEWQYIGETLPKNVQAAIERALGQPSTVSVEVATGDGGNRRIWRWYKLSV